MTTKANTTDTKATDLNKVTYKINGQPMVADLSKMHPTWISHLLQYGVRRYTNDKFAGEKGQTKWTMVRGLLDDMENGEEMPATVRGSGGGSAHDPITTLALKNAKAALTIIFKNVTDATKALDFAKHKKVAPFFKVTEDRAVWVDARVLKWMENRKEATGKDYMGEAKVAIEAASSDLGELGL